MIGSKVVSSDQGEGGQRVNEEGRKPFSTLDVEEQSLEDLGREEDLGT